VNALKFVFGVCFTGCFVLAAEKNWNKIVEIFFNKHVSTYVSTSLPDGKAKFIKGKRPIWCADIRRAPSILIHQKIKSGLSSEDFKDKKFISVRTNIKTKIDAQVKKIRLHYYELDQVDDQENPHLSQPPKEVFSQEFEFAGTNFQHDFAYAPKSELWGGILTLIARVDILSIADNVAKPNIGCIAEISSTIPDQK
jgi:hypothetical protein